MNGRTCEFASLANATSRESEQKKNRIYGDLGFQGRNWEDARQQRNNGNGEMYDRLTVHGSN